MMAAITFVPQDPATMSATDPSAWIGRSQRIDDHLSHNLLARIAAGCHDRRPAVAGDCGLGAPCGRRYELVPAAGPRDIHISMFAEQPGRKA